MTDTSRESAEALATQMVYRANFCDASHEQQASLLLQGAGIIATLLDERDEWWSDHPFTKRLAKERDDLRAKLEETQALLEGRFSDVRLVEFRDGAFVFRGEMMACLIEGLAQMLSGPKAPNFVTMNGHHPEFGAISITVQRTSGLTPSDKIAAVEAENARLKEALRVNGLRLGASHEDIDRVIAECAEKTEGEK